MLALQQRLGANLHCVHDHAETAIGSAVNLLLATALAKVSFESVRKASGQVFKRPDV
jgi:hypothetical protein